jgi:ankyrin repeat protein
MMTNVVASSAFGQSLDDVMKAVEAGRIAEVATLLDRGLDVNTSDKEGNTLLMLAGRYGHPDLVRLILSRRADVARRNRYGDSALMMASLKGDLAAVKVLVDAGAEFKATGWNALHYAAFGGAADVVSYLISKGADKNAVAPNGYTPLMLAVRDGRVDAAKALLYVDADANFRNRAGETALKVAEKREQKELVELLKRAGARE